MTPLAIVASLDDTLVDTLINAFSNASDFAHIMGSHQRFIIANAALWRVATAMATETATPKVTSYKKRVMNKENAKTTTVVEAIVQDCQRLRRFP